MNSGTEGAEKTFRTLKMVDSFFSPNTWQSSTLDALISKIPFSFFAAGHLRGPGVSFGRIWVEGGGASVEPFWAGSSQTAVSPPPPPKLQARPPPHANTIAASRSSGPGSAFQTAGLEPTHTRPHSRGHPYLIEGTFFGAGGVGSPTTK